MANPNPEVAPEEIEDVARGVGTGRSDYPNQINNVLAFPGVFRGALDVRASAITREMELAAAHALAGCRRRRAPGGRLRDAERLRPDASRPPSRRPSRAAAEESGVARRRRTPTPAGA